MDGIEKDSLAVNADERRLDQGLLFLMATLLIYYLIHLAITLSPLQATGGVTASIAPVAWMLGAAMGWAARRGRDSDYFMTAGRWSRRTGVAAIVAGLILAVGADLGAAASAEFREAGAAYHAAIGMVLLAPFAEEFLFRGILLDLLVSRFGRTGAVVQVSGLFAFMHLPQGIFIQMFLFSVILCLVTVKTRHILVSCGIHFAWNLTVFIHHLTA